MRGLFLIFAVACLVFVGPGKAQEYTHEYKLDNGLELIVQEDHRAPVAVVQVWYRVGSSYEHDGITGISHALEHMMFKRTKKLKTGEFSELVAARGGRENAFTSYDYTAYFQQWSAKNIALSFELEAERMSNLVIDDEEFAKEIKVVLEERRLRTDDNPQSLAMESARAAAFQTSPYRYPVIGWASDIKNMKAVDLRAWYKRWYGPNNAIVVVVGDVDPAHVFTLAKSHFGHLKMRDIPPPRPRPEVPQPGLKRIKVRSSTAKVPYLVLGFKAPTLTQAGIGRNIEEWEIYALEVLAEVLDGDPSARLNRNLVRGSELATQTGVGFSAAARLPTLFYCVSVPRDGTTLVELEDALLSEIETLKVNPPTEKELERIKTRVVANAIYELDSVQHQAMLIGSLRAVGLDWRLKDTYVDAIKAVTTDQVRSVAKKYLNSGGLTVAVLIPENGS